MQSDSVAAVLPALLKASQHFEPVKKTKSAHQYKYTDMAGVMDVVRGPLADAGLFVLHEIERALATDESDLWQSTTRVVHAESGEWVSASLPLDAEQPDQGLGSALTYRRRYCLLGLLGLAPEDDDGQAASDARKSRQTAPKQHARPMGVEKPKDVAPANVAPQKPNPKAFWDSVRKIMDGGGVITDHKKQEVIVRGMVEDAGHESTKDLSQAETNTLLAKLADTYGAGATQDDPPF